MFTTSYTLQAELGFRLARIRLTRNITQTELAKEAGVGVRTVRRLESGESTTLDSFLRIVTALELADDVLNSIPSQNIRPIERVDSRQSVRKRASSRKVRDSEEPWIWGD